MSIENINIINDLPGETIKIKKPTKTFKEYYKNPEFKKRHNEYIKTKIPCPICNKSVARYNLGKHKKTQKCQNIGLFWDFSRS